MKQYVNHESSDDGTAAARIGSAADVSNQNIMMASLLPSDGRLVTVVKDEPLLNGIKVMAKYDYSQVPIVKRGKFTELTEDNIYGVLSWETICSEMIHTDFDVSCRISKFAKAGTKWSKCRDTDMIKDLVGKLLKTDYEYVLVMDEKQIVKGIVTYYDIAKRYIALVEPFSAIESIERELRRKLSVLTPVELGTAETEIRKRSRGTEDIEPIKKGVDDLEFYEYQYLINIFWDRLESYFPCALKDLNKVLPKVNKIRNSVMHFHPKDLTEAHRMEVNWLKKLLRI